MESSIEEIGFPLFELGEDVKLRKLSLEYEIKPFDCGVKDLNEFLFNDAKSYMKSLYYTTFLYENKEKTISYYSLANDRLELDLNTNRELGSKIKKESKYTNKQYYNPPFPAVKIGRLAVDKDFQKKGLGSFILKMLVISFIKNNKTGCQFITVDALKDALKFYKDNGFVEIIKQIPEENSIPLYKSLFLD